MYLQKEILEWLSTLAPNSLKQALTIKNPANSIYLKRILAIQPESKPNDHISHGYSEAYANNQKTIYFRDKYRYKKKKQEKEAMGKILLQNVTVSRLSKWSFSLKKSFIKTKEFIDCLLLFSDNQIFNFTDLKQTPVKLGAKKQVKSIWFEPTHFKSFFEWLIYLFELEMCEAYQQQKQTKIDLNKELSHFKYAEEHITPQFLKVQLQQLLYTLSQKRFNGKFAKKTCKRETFFSKDQEEQEFSEVIQVKVQEVPYLLSRCLQKFQVQDRLIDEIIFEYQWYTEDRTSKVNRLLKDICRIVARKFKDFELDAKVSSIEALTQSNKKKKRKNAKKAKEENQTVQIQKPEKVNNLNWEQEQHDQENQSKRSYINNDPKIEVANQLQQTKKTESQIIQTQIQMQKNQQNSSKALLIQQSDSIDFEVKKQNKAKQSKRKKKKERKNAKAQQQLQVIILQQPQEKLDSKNSVPNMQKQKQPKKQVRQKINEFMISYQKQLTQYSQSMDKYRKICLQLIQESITELKLQVKWELLLFGSYSIDFALRQSDLDLVILVENTQALSLQKLKSMFKVKEWLRECQIVQIQSAKVDVLQFEIILSCVKHPKIKETKRIITEVIHVDITLAKKGDHHQGIRNTAIMKELFELHPSLKIVSLVFKELLRIYELNKPFKGGIGSFVLVILVYNILSMEKAQMDDDYAQQIMKICQYMMQKFQPYKTLITPYKNTVLKVNSKQELNIQDPKDNLLINTAKIRKMNEIIEIFRLLHRMLNQITDQLMKIGIEQRKKMKRIFFEKWELLFRPIKESELEK